jgi:hypothetical protein
VEETKKYPSNETNETKSAHYNIMKRSRPRKHGICFRNKMDIDLQGDVHEAGEK